MLSLALLLQLAATSTPARGDTTGYWQQRVHYTIMATLIEETATLHSSANAVYVNNSPDTLRELYLHQYLNAFRPHSKWSEADASEGRVRFQNLRDPDYAYERFTGAAPVRVRFSNTDLWIPIAPEYPGAPDSTVVRLALPRPLASGDSLTLGLQWDARLSTVPRRQGRRGRHYDFAQWYPKIAVYDRGGWQHNALTPAGEFYGEFGTYDVTVAVREDQVIGATGVPVSGDPGWERVRRWGAVFPGQRPRASYKADTTPPRAGFKHVRWIAENVHHFGWSTSPDYVYEGAAYVRQAPDTSAVAAFDTVGIHVLYRPGDEQEWGNGVVVRRVAQALGWLESLYGPYVWPQLTSLHRLDRGGTEFPMLMMNGSPSIGLNLHEGGHMYSYGILANNEWRSAWMDEGLTDHQTRWAQGLTAHERAQRPAPVAAPVKGYRRHAILPWSWEAGEIEQHRLQLTRRAKPLATPSTRYDDFNVYQDMVYGRAETMYSSLRDAMGDSTFVRFLRDYYSTWALKHVDELAMRTSAERAYGKPVGWFFDQWLHRTGVTDYSLENVRTERSGAEWVTSADVVKRGNYFHPVPLGVRTSAGWVTIRGDATRAEQRLEVRTTEQPLDVRLDPRRTTDDWDRRNDVEHRGLFNHDARRVILDRPFLDHVDRERSVMRIRPEAWYSDQGGLSFGARARSRYLGWIDRYDAGLAYAVRGPRPMKFPTNEIPVSQISEDPLGRLQGWFTAENFRWGKRAPAIGTSAGVWVLDGVTKLDARKRFNDEEFREGPGRKWRANTAVTGTLLYDETWSDRSRWQSHTVAGVSAELDVATSNKQPWMYRALIDVGFHAPLSNHSLWSDIPFYSRTELEVRRRMVRGSDGNRMRTGRLLLALSSAPIERTTMLSAQNPTESFDNHFVRPERGLLAPQGSDAAPTLAYIVPGGAYVRGYDARLPLGNAVAMNLEESYRLGTFGPTTRRVQLWTSIFADVAVPVLGDSRRITNRVLGDAGPGVALRGRIFDRNITLRADFPIYVRAVSDNELDFRVRLSARDLF